MMTTTEDQTTIDNLTADVAARDAVLAAVRAHNAQFLVDHSGHVDSEGRPCQVEQSWANRDARNLSAILDRAPADTLAAYAASVRDAAFFAAINAVAEHSRQPVGP